MLIVSTLRGATYASAKSTTMATESRVSEVNAQKQTVRETSNVFLQQQLNANAKLVSDSTKNQFVMTSTSAIRKYVMIFRVPIQLALTSVCRLKAQVRLPPQCQLDYWRQQQ